MDSIIHIILGQIIGTVVAGFGVYVAIRADLSQLNARMLLLEKSNERAHVRLDLLKNS